jgi:ribosomal protein S27AE
MKSKKRICPICGKRQMEEHFRGYRCKCGYCNNSKGGQIKL